MCIRDRCRIAMMQGAGYRVQGASGRRAAVEHHQTTKTMTRWRCSSCHVFMNAWYSFKGIIISHVRIDFFQDTTVFGLVLYSFSRHNHVRIYLSTNKWKKKNNSKQIVEIMVIAHCVDPRSSYTSHTAVSVLTAHRAPCGPVITLSNAVSYSVDRGVRIPPRWEREFSKRKKRDQLLKAWVGAIRRESTREKRAEAYSLWDKQGTQRK